MNWPFIGVLLAAGAVCGFGVYCGVVKQGNMMIVYPILLVLGLAGIGAGVGLRFIFDLLAS